MRAFAGVPGADIRVYHPIAPPGGTAPAEVSMSDSTFEHPGEPGRDGQAENATELHRPVDFTIDGRPERTTVRRQTAADLLRLVGLDPARYYLGHEQCSIGGGDEFGKYSEMLGGS